MARVLDEITQLAWSGITVNEFYREMLPRLVEGSAAVAGIVWILKDRGRIVLEQDVHFQKTGLREKDRLEPRRHWRLLRKILASGEGLLVPAHSPAGEGDEGGNPTDFPVVAGPLGSMGVVEAFCPPIRRWPRNKHASACY